MAKEDVFRKNQYINKGYGYFVRAPYATGQKIDPVICLECASENEHLTLFCYVCGSSKLIYFPPDKVISEVDKIQNRMVEQYRKSHPEEFITEGDVTRVEKTDKPEDLGETFLVQFTKLTSISETKLIITLISILMLGLLFVLALVVIGANLGG